MFVLGVYYIVKASFTALITIYYFQKFLFCPFSALDKICDRRIHSEQAIYHLEVPYNHFYAFFTSPFPLIINSWRRGTTTQTCLQNTAY